jgi:hypothetical protein
VSNFSVYFLKAEVLQKPVLRICKVDGGSCELSSCSIIRDNGKVVVCIRHGNPGGRFLSHFVKERFS